MTLDQKLTDNKKPITGLAEMGSGINEN